jgi:hypothetical protein
MLTAPVILASDLLTTPPLVRAEFQQGHDSAHVLRFDENNHASPIGVVTAVLAACECLPEIIDEFEGMECF